MTPGNSLLLERSRWVFGPAEPRSIRGTNPFAFARSKSRGRTDEVRGEDSRNVFSGWGHMSGRRMNEELRSREVQKGPDGGVDPHHPLHSSESDTNVVSPLIYSLMGSSREIAISPVAVVSLLFASMMERIVDRATGPGSHRKLVFTAAFFAGKFQAIFGLFMLGFLVDFLSHAEIVGFMAGAAIGIGLQQLKGMLGFSHFTTICCSQ
ncbi:hypothetical protein MLD38_024642 [Melastoma candidum]|uniref:Uncharacterized protein n=1 Tax=Melastoma candidum TaxID=119954 RepID=A0ACB9NT02_9MYRT|nr:hypothetical protein MLD38_024642 [Melastoma candidum]